VSVAPAPGEVLLDAVEIGCRAVEAPAVAHQRDERDEQDPDRPERPARAGERPDRGADHERDERSAALLQEAALELAAAAGDVGALLGARRRQVGPQRVELAL